MLFHKKLLANILIGSALFGLSACGEVDVADESLAAVDATALSSTNLKSDDAQESSTAARAIDFSLVSSLGDGVGQAEIDMAKSAPEILSEALEFTGAALPESGDIPAQELLAPFGQTHALKYTKIEGINCWYTAIASVMKGFTEERFMDSDEFACQLRAGFKATTKPQFGDVVRFQSASGEEIHGAVYIGVDKKTGEVILFSKNGMHKVTAFGFSTLKTLTTRMYKDTAKVTYYRPLTAIRDPQSESEPCYKEAQESRKQSELLKNGGNESPWHVGPYGHLPPM